MSVLGSSFEVFRFLVFLVIFSSVCIAFPVQTPVKVQAEDLLNGIPLDGADDFSFDTWSAYHERTLSKDDPTIPTTTSNSTSSDADAGDKSNKKVDPLSLVYYIGSFAALLLFFLVVSCSECCCEKSPTTRGLANTVIDDCMPPEDANPPPPYDDFAPPAYDSLFATENGTKAKLNVFVVPTHGSHLAPP